MALQGILERPSGIFNPLTVQVASVASNIQANIGFIQCFLRPQTAASVTVAKPFNKKNDPIRMMPSLVRTGDIANMWKTAIRPKAPKTPSDRATTTGTPYFGSPYRRGAYAKDVQGAAKALCQVSDLSEYSMSKIQLCSAPR